MSNDLLVEVQKINKELAFVYQNKDVQINSTAISSSHLPENLELTIKRGDEDYKLMVVCSARGYDLYFNSIIFPRQKTKDLNKHLSSIYKLNPLEINLFKEGDKLIFINKNLSQNKLEESIINSLMYYPDKFNRKTLG